MRTAFVLREMIALNETGAAQIAFVTFASVTTHVRLQIVAWPITIKKIDFILFMIMETFCDLACTL